jgi:hypothetical protein
VNEDGFYEVGTDQEEAATRLMETQGGYQCRTVKLTVSVTPPVAAGATAEIPDDAGSTVTVEVSDDDTGDHAVDPRATD